MQYLSLAFQAIHVHLLGIRSAVEKIHGSKHFWEIAETKEKKIITLYHTKYVPLKHRIGRVFSMNENTLICNDFISKACNWAGPNPHQKNHES